MSEVMRSLELPVMQALGWALLHFLWQGVAISMFMALMLLPMKHASAQRRYLVLCSGLVVMTACPFVTGIWIATSSNSRSIPVASSVEAPIMSSLPEVPELGPSVVSPTMYDLDFAPLEVAPAAAGSNFAADLSVSRGTPLMGRDLLARFLPWLVATWITGVLILSLRLMAGWRIVQRMKRDTVRPVPDDWQRRLKSLAIRLRVSRPVQLVESALVDVPTVIGWLKPMILIPASALTGLTVPQLEAVLAHELAHIRRHDYLVNLVQTVVETLLFYHPAVWWLSHRIRDERENCCDDLAVEICGSPLDFAQALTAMETLRSPARGQTSSLALAASGGSLLARIRRLALRTTPDVGHSTWWGASLITLTAVAMLGVASYVTSRATADHVRDVPGVEASSQDETKPANSQQATETPTEPTDAGDPLQRKVSLVAKEMPLKAALLKLAAEAGLEMQLDVDALGQAELNLDEPVTVILDQMPLANALTQLINWHEHPGVMREMRSGKLVLTTLTAWQERIFRRLPEWMKPLYNHGLLARLDDKDQVVTVTTSGIVTDQFLGQLKSLPELRELHMEMTKDVTPAGLAELGKLPQLRQLTLYNVNSEGTGLGDDVIRGLIGSTSLRELSISECGTTDAGAKLLEQLPLLTSLSLRQEGRLTDEALKSIGTLSKLKSLSLMTYVGTERFGWMRFSAEGIRQLGRLSELQSLHLVGQEVTAEVFSFPKLTSLSLGHHSVDNAVAAKIGQLTQLRSLELSYSRIDDDGLKWIAGLPELRRLDLSSLAVTDTAIEHFRTHKRLEHISLRAGGLTDAALQHLAQIHSLTRLDLSGNGHPGVAPGMNFTIAGLQQLKALGNLQTLWLSNCNIPGGGYIGLKELKQLRELTMMMCNVTDVDLDALEEALPNTRISHVTGGGGRLPKQLRKPKGLGISAIETNAVSDQKEPDGKAKVLEKLPVGMIQRLGTVGSTDSIHSAQVNCVRFVDNETLATSSVGDARVWNIRKGTQEHILAHKIKTTNIKGLATSPDGLLVVTSAMDNTFGIWNRTTGERLATLQGHGERGGIRIVRFRPDGTQFVSWGDDAVLRWWKSNGVLSSAVTLDLPGYATEESKRPPFGYETSQAFSPDAKSLFVVLDGQLFEYDTATGKRVRQSPIPKFTMPLAVSADGRWIATGETRRDDNGDIVSSAVILRDRATLKVIREWPVRDPRDDEEYAGPQKVSWIGQNDNSLTFSPDSRYLAWSRGGTRNAIDIVDVAQEWLHATIPLESLCWSLEFSPNGTYVATGHSDSRAIVWNRMHPAFVARQVPRSGRWVPANRTIRVQVVDAQDGKPLEGIVVEAERWEGARQYEVDGVGTTDAKGFVEFKGLDAIMYIWEVLGTKPIPYIPTFATSSADQDHVVLKLPRACELTLHAVDAETGRGIPGVLFGRERAAGEYWLQDVDSDTLTLAKDATPPVRRSDTAAGIAARIKARQSPPRPPKQSVLTDATGTFRALVDSATWSYSVASFPDGYDSVVPINGLQELEIETPAGGRVEYTFKLRKKTPRPDQR